MRKKGAAALAVVAAVVVIVVGARAGVPAVDTAIRAVVAAVAAGLIGWLVFGETVKGDDGDVNKRS